MPAVAGAHAQGRDKAVEGLSVVFTSEIPLFCGCSGANTIPSVEKSTAHRHAQGKYTKRHILNTFPVV